MTAFQLTASALAAIAIAPMRAMPAWFYRLKITQRKPLNCEGCLAFWIATAWSTQGAEPHMAPLFGLAASGLACVIWRIIS